VYSLLERTRELAENPLQAAQAYENTARAIYEAEQAARAAVNASQAAYNKVPLVLYVYINFWLIFSHIVLTLLNDVGVIFIFVMFSVHNVLQCFVN